MDGVVSHTRAVQALQITARDAEKALSESLANPRFCICQQRRGRFAHELRYLNEKVGAMSQTAELRSQALEEKLYPRHLGPRRREESLQRYGGIRDNIRLSN